MAHGALAEVRGSLARYSCRLPAPSRRAPPLSPAAPRRPALRTPARGGTPEALARAAHWQIAALHHIRDVTMKEDAQGLRAGTSAQVAASLRNTSIAALRLAGFTSAAARRRWAARNPLRPLTILNLIQRERP